MRILVIICLYGREFNIVKIYTPKKVAALYFECREALGRQPEKEEFENLYSEAVKSIKRGNYHPSIRTWNQFLISLGEKILGKDEKC